MIKNRLTCADDYKINGFHLLKKSLASVFFFRKWEVTWLRPGLMHEVMYKRKHKVITSCPESEEKERRKET
jgi:hypothetical protein